jgi:hypothetical protein
MVPSMVDTGNLGMLKKSNTSKYSSSFGAGVRAGVTEGSLALLLSFGCLEIRKSRSNAHLRISAKIFTVEGVTRSPFRSAFVVILGTLTRHVREDLHNESRPPSTAPVLEEC